MDVCRERLSAGGSVMGSKEVMHRRAQSDTGGGQSALRSAEKASRVIPALQLVALRRGK